MIYTGPFSDLPRLRYQMIVADPPWSFTNYSSKGERKNAKAHYDCMSLEEIKALPVGHLAQRDAWLFLWATNPMLPQALDVMRAWGFQFKTKRTWVKTTASGKIAFGTGYIVRGCDEMLLIGTIGKPPILARNIRSAFLAPAREHSRKPDLAYEEARRMSDGPRIELFSREEREGYDTWGSQAGLFSSQGAA